MCRVRANQKFEICVSTCPLPGIGSGSTTSKALKPVRGDDQHVSRIDGVDVAHLALVQPDEPRERATRASAEVWLAADMRFPCVRLAPPGAATIRRLRRRPMLQAPPSTVKESMGWYGKLFGALIGAIVGRGWLGALIGFLIGHQLDRQAAAGRVGRQRSARSQRGVFRATFQVMGHVAKSDGRVSRAGDRGRAGDDAALLARRGRRSGAAIEFFTDGKRPDFALRETLEELRRLDRAAQRSAANVRADSARGGAAGQRTQPGRAASLSARSARGSASPRSSLRRSRRCCACVRGWGGPGRSRRRRRGAHRRCLRVLGVAPAATDAEVKKRLPAAR